MATSPSALAARRASCSSLKASTSAPSIPFPSMTPPTTTTTTTHRHLSSNLPRGSRTAPVRAYPSSSGEVFIPDMLMGEIRAAAGAPGAAAGAGGGGGGRPRRRGPPDLPSLLMDGRIVYLGMPVSDSMKRRSGLCVSSDGKPTRDGGESARGKDGKTKTKIRLKIEKQKEKKTQPLHFSFHVF
jgi:hypothetical protein